MILISSVANYTVKPIVLIAIVGATLALTVGYMGNGIDMTMLQVVGVGETDIDSSGAASVQAIISQIGKVANMKDFFVACVFEGPDPLGQGSILICKLIDVNGSVIGEGKTTLQMELPANTPVSIPLDDAIDVNAVFDIIFVVQGPP